MARKKILVFVITSAFVLGCAFVWLVVAQNRVEKIGSSTLFPLVIAVLALCPLYPLYRFAKRWPRLRIGLVMVIGCLMVILLLTITHELLHLDSPWIHTMSNIAEILCFLSSLVLVWQGLRRHT